jgi:hypothetical protein
VGKCVENFELGHRTILVPLPLWSFATRSCQQQVRSCSLCTESGSKFRAFDDTSTGYCGLMALPGT